MEPTPAEIFISYRRSISADIAERLHGILSKWFGDGRVFLDKEEIQPGEPFPERLVRAIRSARIVLVLMAPKWLEELVERATHAPGEIDYVRQEVSLALRLAEPAGPTTDPAGAKASPNPARLRIIPVLAGGQAMYAGSELRAKGFDDLARIVEYHGVDLGGPEDRWQAVVDELCVGINTWVGLLPVPAIADQKRVAAAAKVIQDKLDWPEMKCLAQRWDSSTLIGQPIDKALDLLVAYAQEVRNSMPEWRKLAMQAEARDEVKQRCIDILAELAGLFVDGARIRLALTAAKQGKPLSMGSASTLGVVGAIAAGVRPTLACEQGKNTDFLTRGTVDLGDLDAGIGKDRKAAVHHAARAEVLGADGLPSAPGVMSTEQLEEVKSRAFFLRNVVKRQFFLTHKMAADGAVDVEMKSFADELEFGYLPRTGTPGNLLRIPELSFRGLVGGCLDDIENIK